MAYYRPICSTDPALWRRLVIVPFNCHFVDRPELPHERLKDDKVKDNLPNDIQAVNEFFAWLVQGAPRMYIERLTLPKCIADTTNEYKANQDIYSRFVEERIERSNDPRSEWNIPAKELYEIFVDWCKMDEGIAPVSNKIFGENIKRILGPPSRNRYGNVHKRCRLFGVDQQFLKVR
ncbi:Hypothetical protein HVR_LOCUS345 [uncultured virus]|nr:Hypothetical protein HVR_LOCUS345 [uncultured virus]